jgi:hypothetical protein
MARAPPPLPLRVPLRMRQQLLLVVVIVVACLLVAPCGGSRGDEEAAHDTAASHFGWRAIRSAARTKIPRHRSVTSKVTLVTAFFDLGARSKHKPAEYSAWLANFLPHVETPLVVFTTASMLGTLRGSRGARPSIYVTYDSLWDVPPARHYRADFEKQHALDPEKHMHYPELYALWSSKVWFAFTAAAHNPFSSQYFMWIDAGVFRSKSYSKWPSPRKLETALNACGRDDCILLSDVSQSANSDETHWGSNWTVDPGPHQAFHGRDKLEGLRDQLQGAVFAGRGSAMVWWTLGYYSVMHDHVQHGVFAGKEQNIFDDLMVRNFWRVVLLPERRLRTKCRRPDTAHGAMDIYYAFQAALAEPSDAPAKCQLELEMYKGTINIQRGPLALARRKQI